MLRFRPSRASWLLCLIAVLISAGTLATRGERSRETPRMRVATGQFITPLAAPGSRIDALQTDLRSDNNANATAPPGYLSFGGNRLYAHVINNDLDAWTVDAQSTPPPFIERDLPGTNRDERTVSTEPELLVPLQIEIHSR